MRHLLLFVSLWLIGATVASGQVQLEHKLIDGTTIVSETQLTFTQKLTIAGTDIETDNDTKVTSRSSVAQRDSTGQIKLETKVESFQATINVMGQNYTFDSANPDEKGGSPLEVYRPLHKAVATRATTTTFDKSNRPVSVAFDEDVLASLPAELRDVARSQLDPAALKSEAIEEYDRIKSDGVSPGDTWTRNKSFNFGSGQVMDFKTEFTYTGTIEQGGRTLDKITSKVNDVTYALVNSTLPFTLKSSSLKAAESDGVLLFDRKLGRVVDATSNVRVTGDITFVVNGNDLPATIDLKMKTVTRDKP